MNADIFSYIKEQENTYETQEIRLGDNWSWNMRNHIQLIFHLINGVFFTGENNWLRAFKNIMEPMLQLSFWTEDIEVKDIVFYVTGSNNRVKSFLLKRYHDDVFVKKYNVDTLIDEITETDLEYGGVLVQKGKDIPEVLKMNTIAFCDQTNVLGGPIGLKYNFSPQALRGMSKLGWGSDKNGADISIEDLIVLADFESSVPGDLTKQNDTSGKQIEVYIVRGNLPNNYLKDDNDMETFSYQLHVVAFYTDKDKNKQGVSLYRKPEDDANLKFFSSKPVYSRGLGRGVGEALLPTQIWTNYLEIHKMNMLAAASKVPLYTDDPTYTEKNRISDMETLEVTTIEDGKRIYQVPTAAPANIQLMDNAINAWYEQAQLSGASFDPLMGKESPSGTTFRGQERSVAQGRGIHDRRRGQRAKFIEELYRDYIIPKMIKEITGGVEFLATLSSDEVQWVSDQLAENYASNKIVDDIIEGSDIETDLNAKKEIYKQDYLKQFSKKGKQVLLKLLDREFGEDDISVGINVAGKQKDLAQMSDKLLSIIQFAASNPQGFQQVMQMPGMAKAFNDIL